MDNHMDNNPNGNRPDNNKGPGRQDPNKNHQSILAFLVCLLVTLVCFAMFTNMLKDNSSEITYDKFIEMVDDGDVKEVTLQSNTLTITPKHQSSGFSEEVYYANQMESVDKLTERLEGTGIKFEYKKPDAAGEIISMLVSVLLPTILLFVLLTVFMRRMNKGGGMMAREEYNLPLNKEAYEHLIKKADGNIITKKRYEIPDGNGYTIELDIFEGLFAGTILAEVEFPTIEAANSYTVPSWFIDDVTNDPAYHNSNMSRKVF